MCPRRVAGLRQVAADAWSQLREDHFVYGPSEQTALLVHCERILQTALRLHYKTRHLVHGLVIGTKEWRVEQLQNQKVRGCSAQPKVARTAECAGSAG